MIQPDVIDFFSLQSSRDRPDQAEVRRRYEHELKVQMEEKKRHDDEIKRKEREEEEKLERRLQEQQEKMKREYEEEQNKKKEKEQAVTHQNVLIFHFILICPVEIEATGGACQEAGQAAAGDGQAEERGGHETTRREEERLRW